MYRYTDKHMAEIHPSVFSHRKASRLSVYYSETFSWFCTVFLTIYMCLWENILKSTQIAFIPIRTWRYWMNVIVKGSLKSASSAKWLRSMHATLFSWYQCVSTVVHVERCLVPSTSHCWLQCGSTVVHVELCLLLSTPHCWHHSGARWTLIDPVGFALLTSLWQRSGVCWPSFGAVRSSLYDR
jgi:hypothetical protein